jgi:outer membrane receptor protein involved in Fe transport
MKKRTRIRVAALVLLMGAATALAQQGDSIPRSFDIPAQPLDRALTNFAQTTGLQLLVVSELTVSRMAPSVSGMLTAEGALDQLLRNSGLTYHFVNDRTVAIGSRELVNAQAKPSDARTARPQAARAGSSAKQIVDPNSGLNLGGAIPEVLVKGARSLNTDIQRSRDDTQPYVIFDRKLIETAGATSIDDLFKRHLSMNTTGLSSNQQSSIFGNASQINLRGLGTSQTLILVDGRRVAGVSAGGNSLQPDLNGIPISAIERIEVLPTSASGIYGGSATGGVVNVVLRRDYTGTEVKLEYENAFTPEAGARRISIGQGLSLFGGATRISLFGNYSEQNDLLFDERDFLQRGRDEILKNNPDFFLAPTSLPPLGRTTNIQSVNGSPLFGAGSSNFTSVPEGYSGGGGVTPLRANAGRYNLDLADSAQQAGGGRGLLNGPTSKSLGLTVRQDISPAFAGFIDLSAASNTSRFSMSGFDFTTGLVGTTVNANAPNNPFGQAVRVTVPTNAGDGEHEVEHTLLRAAGGLVYRLPRDWSLAGDYSWSRAGLTRFQPRAVSAAAAIANGTLDVFRDTSANPLDLSPYLRRYKTSSLRSTSGDANLRLAGPLLKTDAGPLTLSALLEHREDHIGDGEGVEFSDSGPGTAFVPTGLLVEREQTVDSAYVELKIPLIPDRRAAPGLRQLQLQLAVRSDRYRTNAAPARVTPGSTAPIPRVRSEFTSTDPTVGLRYTPFRSLTFRASYGTGFLPPGVSDFTQIGPFPFPAGILIDPRRGNTTTGAVLQLGGGNAGIRPERSESRSIGFVFTPPLPQGFRASVDYTEIRKRDDMTTLSAQQMINFESSFPDRVTRDAVAPGDPYGVGAITSLDLSLVNLARTKVEAYDVSIDYELETAALGSFGFYLAGTWQPHYVTQPLPGTPEIENAGISSSSPLNVKGNVGAHWTLRGWTFGWTMRHFDSYRVADPSLTASITTIRNQGSARVPSQSYHDLFGKYAFGAGPAVLSNLEVLLAVTNVFDKSPPFDASAGSTGFYSPFGDPRLATYSLSLKKNF